MKCLKCHKVFDDKIQDCPFCHEINQSLDTLSDYESNENIIENKEKQLSKTMEVKPSKSKIRDDSEVSLDKTIAIGIENSDTLIDQINKQIDEMNEEVTIKENKTINDEADNINLDSLDSFKKRRKVLIITAIISVILVSIIICLIVFTKDISDKSKIEETFDQRLNNAITTYYKDKEIDDLIYLMEDVKKDSSKIEIIQIETSKECNNWLLNYVAEDSKSKKEFEDITYEYRELIDGLYRYALVKNEDAYIRALTEEDYDAIIIYFEDIYSQGLDFYDGLDLYNEKDYNRAYYMFSKIEEENTYYEKSLTYVDKIFENIIELLRNDILKIEKDINNLSDEEKLDLYITIEETILEYNNVYTFELSDYEEYQNILNDYTSKVSEYTEKVYKK